MQGHLFDPNNPPHSFEKEEVDAQLDALRAKMRQYQLDRINMHNMRKHGGDDDGE